MPHTEKHGLFVSQNFKEVHKLKKRTNKSLGTADKQSRYRFPAAKAAYYNFLAGMAFLAYTQPVYAATDVWTKASVDYSQVSRHKKV